MMMGIASDQDLPEPHRPGVEGRRLRRDFSTKTRGELVRFLSCFWLLRSSGTPHVLEPRAACIAIAYELIF